MKIRGLPADRCARNRTGEPHRRCTINTPKRRVCRLAALMAGVASIVAGSHFRSAYAEDRPLPYDRNLPPADAQIGVQKQSPYLYRYENDWQRNRAWRERDNPLLYIPKLPEQQNAAPLPGVKLLRKDPAPAQNDETTQDER